MAALDESNSYEKKLFDPFIFNYSCLQSFLVCHVQNDSYHAQNDGEVSVAVLDMDAFVNKCKSRC